MRRMKLFAFSITAVGWAVLLAACINVMSGCSTLERNPATAQLVVQYATAKYLENKPEAERYAAAQRILKVSGELRAVVGSMETNLDSLRERLSVEIAKQTMSPADRVLAEGLANVVFSELETRFKSPALTLDPEQVVAVNTFLTWIEQIVASTPPPA